MIDLNYTVSTDSNSNQYQNYIKLNTNLFDLLIFFKYVLEIIIFLFLGFSIKKG